MADLGDGLAWRWEGYRSGGGIFTHGCPVSGHIRGSGGQADSNHCFPAPPPPICAGVIKNIWLPIMAPVSSREVEQSCEGCVHNSAQLRAAMNTQPALASTYQSTATACCKYIRASLQEGRRLVKECLWRRRVWKSWPGPLNPQDGIKENKWSWENATSTSWACVSVTVPKAAVKVYVSKQQKLL